MRDTRGILLTVVNLLPNVMICPSDPRCLQVVPHKAWRHVWVLGPISRVGPGLGHLRELRKRMPGANVAAGWKAPARSRSADDRCRQQLNTGHPLGRQLNRFSFRERNRRPRLPGGVSPQVERTPGSRPCLQADS
jgi:hypothetical protein